MRPGTYTNWHNAYFKTTDRLFFKYINNGFFSRDLDADDWQFIEHVRECGIANGQEPNTSACLIEELDYWHFPYAIDYSAFRRYGPPPRSRPMIPYAADAASHAQRVRNRQAAAEARAAMQAEWKRQEAEQAAEREKRLKATMESDALWEDEHQTIKRRDEENGSFAGASVADRRERPYYRQRPQDLPQRHYVPQWKREGWPDPARKKRRKLGLFQPDELTDILEKIRHSEPEEELV